MSITAGVAGKKLLSRCLCSLEDRVSECISLLQRQATSFIRQVPFTFGIINLFSFLFFF